MIEEIKFEKALEKLGKIVEDLEEGNTDLEEALKKYEEGVKLSALCQKRLAEAEKKIEILTRSLDGSMKRRPFDPDDTNVIEEREASGRKSRAKITQKTKESEPAENDEDLLI
jgi:exodeoxyribonuclease VII small subunit